ncbi:MAG: transferase, partial [Candidatus Eisenbacteria bacterium]|nr:transferase [Candidatus Eisenbacteria bacterium]
VNHIPEGETLFLNGRLICLGDSFDRLLEVVERGAAVVQDKVVLAARLPESLSAGFYKDLEGSLRRNEKPESPSGMPKEGPPQGSHVVQYLWELIGLNPEVIAEDFSWAKDRPHRDQPETALGAQILGKKNIVFRDNVVLEPGSILDGRHGPIILGEGARLEHQSVVLGPAYIGPRSVVKMGARLYDGISLGPTSKMGGEVEAVITQGFTNKQHDGFLGHAYLGSWTNLGAATNNSDLKNNYSTVRVWTPDGEVDTGEIFVGLFMGDHSKTAIGTKLNTGTVVGFSSNLFGSGFPPKHIPSFAWGGAQNLMPYDFEKAKEVARKVMHRRKVEMEPADEVLFQQIFDLDGLGEAHPTS